MRISIETSPLQGDYKTSYMFKLRSVRPFDIAQRRIRLYDPARNQVVQPQEVLVLAQAVQVPPTKRQGAKVLVDDVEDVFRGCQTQGDVGYVEVSCVVGYFQL